MLWPSEFSQAALDGMLFSANSPRGFEGSLSNVRTPFGLATIMSGASGLSIKLQQE
jgi:hypothetical protein